MPGYKIPVYSWTEEDMKNALKEVFEGSSWVVAGMHYGIPESTIRGRYNRDRARQVKMVQKGRKMALSKTAQKVLADRISCLCERQNEDPTIGQVKAIIEEYVVKHKLKTGFANNKPGVFWMKNFMRRHNFKLHKGRITKHDAYNISNAPDKTRQTECPSKDSYAQDYSNPPNTLSMTVENTFKPLGTDDSMSSNIESNKCGSKRTFTTETVLLRNIRATNAADNLFFSSICSDIQTLSRQDKNALKQKILKAVNEKLII